MRLPEELLKHPEFFFWIVIAIMFFILWRVNKGINKKVIEIRNRKVGILLIDLEAQYLDTIKHSLKMIWNALFGNPVYFEAETILTEPEAKKLSNFISKQTTRKTK